MATSRKKKLSSTSTKSTRAPHSQQQPEKRKKKKLGVDFPVPLILVDTREQKPFLFRKSKNCAGTLKSTMQAGDYCIDGHPDLIVIERKQSMDELARNLGKHRARFIKELKIMSEFKYKFVIVEDLWLSITDPGHSTVHYNSLLGSILSFNLRYGVQFIFAGNRRWAQRITRGLLIKAYEEIHQA